MSRLGTIVTATMILGFLAGCAQVADGSAVPTLSPTHTHQSPPPTDWRPVDAGPREGATGEVTLDGDGVPIAYLVAEGDTPAAVRDRFGIVSNVLAREDGTPIPAFTMIYTGETLTFVPPETVRDR